MFSQISLGLKSGVSLVILKCKEDVKMLKRKLQDLGNILDWLSLH